MKTITNDPQDFIENGGWSFLEPDSSVSQVDACTLNLPVQITSHVTHRSIQPKFRWKFSARLRNYSR